MELVSRLRWVIISFVMLIILILIGWGLYSVARGIFDNGDSGTSQQDSISLDNVTVLRFTNDGPVVANSEHRRYVIEVNQSVVLFTLSSNYGEKIIKQTSYTNSEIAYKNLVATLQKAGATDRVRGTTVEDDFNEKGSCPAGNRFILEMSDIARRWGTSCKKKTGTSTIPMTEMDKLFTSQVPDFDEIMKEADVQL